MGERPKISLKKSSFLFFSDSFAIILKHIKAAITQRNYMDRKEFNNRIHYGETVSCDINKTLFTEAIIHSLKGNISLYKLYAISSTAKKEINSDIAVFFRNIKKVVVDAGDNFKTLYLIVQLKNGTAVSFVYRKGVSEPSIRFSSNGGISDVFISKVFDSALVGYNKELSPTKVERFEHYEWTEIFGIGKVDDIKENFKKSAILIHSNKRYLKRKHKPMPSSVKTFNALVSAVILLTIFTTYQVSVFANSGDIISISAKILGN